MLRETVDNPDFGNTPQGLLDNMVSFVQKTFNPAGQVMPMWTIIGEDGKAYVYMVPFDGEASKNMAAHVIRDACTKHKATMIGFMSETWLAVLPASADPTGVIPSEHPDRKEAIYLTVETSSGKCLSGAMIINRDVGAGVLEPFEQHGEQSLGGRFANMFTKASVH